MQPSALFDNKASREGSEKEACHGSCVSGRRLSVLLTVHLQDRRLRMFWNCGQISLYHCDYWRRRLQHERVILWNRCLGSVGRFMFKEPVWTSIRVSTLSENCFCFFPSYNSAWGWSRYCDNSAPDLSPTNKVGGTYKHINNLEQ